MEYEQGIGREQAETLEQEELIYDDLEQQDEREYYDELERLRETAMHQHNQRQEASRNKSVIENNEARSDVVMFQPWEHYMQYIRAGNTVATP